MKVPVYFTVNELWVLDALVPEFPNMKISPDMGWFRKAVALAIAECAEESRPEAVVELDEVACRVLSQAVSSSLIAPTGQSVGRTILVKTYRAWRHIEDGIALGVTGKSLSKEDSAAEMASLWAFKQAHPMQTLQSLMGQHPT